MDLSILIVNWNTRDLLAQCLASIHANPPEGSFEIIVVDNASTDGSVAMLRSQFPEVCVLENADNPGFAAANNQALARGSGRYLLLLNPDTVVLPDALDALLQFMNRHQHAGAAGSMLLNPDGSLQTSCHPIPTLSREFWRLFHLDALYPLALYPMAGWPTDVSRPVDTIQGASLIVRREVVDQVGGLDESYFMYSEEVDWCERIRQVGWSIYWVPQSQIVHFGGQSTRQVADAMFIQLYRAKLQYFRKHFGIAHVVVYKLELAMAAVTRLLLAPAGWLLMPSKRQVHAQLARNYGRLLVSLPTL